MTCAEVVCGLAVEVYNFTIKGELLYIDKKQAGPLLTLPLLTTKTILGNYHVVPHGRHHAAITSSPLSYIPFSPRFLMILHRYGVVALALLE